MIALEGRRSRALAASLGVHCSIAVLALLAARHGAPPPASVAGFPRESFVWLNTDGHGGGGGGGGNRMKEPPRKPQLPGRDSQTVPAAAPRNVDRPSPDPIDGDHTQRVVIPVVLQALGDTALPGSMSAPPGPPTESRGPGTGDGAGSGDGPGDGAGRGRGLDDGLDENTGGRFYQPGGDVTMPIEIRKGTPQYTSEAMRARAQGAIRVECVVQTNGTCTQIRVLRSFNPSFGLDEEAIKAAARWRFRPGMRRGQPVPVVVTMEIEFAVR